MKRIFAGLLFLAALTVSVFGQQTANVTYNLLDFTSTPQNFATLTITPLFSGGVSGPYLIASQARTFALSGTNSITVSNVVMGYSYQVELDNFNYTTESVWTNQFPATLSGNINARDWIFYNVVYPSTSITQPPAITNTQTGVTLGGTFSGDGSALTNMAFFKTVFAIGNVSLIPSANPDGSSNLTVSVPIALLPYAKTLSSTNGYFVPTVNSDFSTNWTFIFTNVGAAGLPAGQVTGTVATATSAVNSTQATNAAAAGGDILTNGAPGTFDPVTIACIASNNITDPNAQIRLNKFVLDAKQMTAWTNLVRQYFFEPSLNPSNHLDLFGAPITWTNDIYGSFGAQFRSTNTASFSVPSLTNYTVIIWRQNPNAVRAQNGAGSYGEMEMSFENTNNPDAYFLAFVGSYYEVFTGNYQNQYPFASNWPNSNPLAEQSADGGTLPDLYVTPPAIWTFVSYGETNWSGEVNTRLMYNYPTSGKTNILAGNGITNLSPLQVIHLGGSTNWIHGGFSNMTGNVIVTNGWFDCYSVSVFSTMLSSNDVNQFYKALNEIPPVRKQYFMLGDSMMAENCNQVNQYDHLSMRTNFIAYHFMQRHPNTFWHDEAQGGSSLSTFQALSPGDSTWLPSDIEKVFISDFPRNDLAVNSAVSFMLISSNMAAAVSPWLTGNYSYWMYESPMSATNSPNSFSATAVSNLVTGYLVCRTNPIVNRDLNLIDYWYGSMLNTNNGFYGEGSSSGGGEWGNAGLHIENTNSPMFMKMAASFWDTGIWPTAPYPVWTLPYSGSPADYSKGLQSFGWVQ